MELHLKEYDLFSQRCTSKKEKENEEKIRKNHTTKKEMSKK
jgi:hypothetical protein